MSITYTLKALPWDIAILLLLVGGVTLVVLFWKRKKIAPCIFGFLLTVTVFYGSFIEPHIIVVHEEEIVFPAEEEMTIVVLSDMHVGPYKGEGFMRRVVDRVNAIDPDLVLLAGDYVFSDSAPLDGLFLLQELHPRYGTFAVLGNHEYSCYGGNIFTRTKYVGFDVSSRVQHALERIGITVLRNASEKIETESGILFVAGVDDACTGQDDLQASMEEIRQKAPIILLAHDPSVILDNRALYPHLIVSGHTHGGQIRLPLIGPLSPLPTQLGRSYDQGLFTVDKNTTLAITRGVGESGARARLFAPPEILVLRTTP